MIVAPCDAAGVAFTGVVLCGGRSTRMGRDKALLEVAGVAMARRVADALLVAGATEVLAVGGDATALRALGLDARADDRPGAGPLSATITALGQAREDLVLVVGCDLRHPHPPSMARTVAALARSDGALGAVPTIAGQRQWVHAAWRRHAAERLAVELERGRRSLQRAAGALELVLVHDIDPEAVADADHPSELPDP